MSDPHDSQPEVHSGLAARVRELVEQSRKYHDRLDRIQADLVRLQIKLAGLRRLTATAEEPGGDTPSTVAE